MVSDNEVVVLHKWPLPIGSLVTKEDFVPSIMFATLYFLVFLLGLYRLCTKGKRTVLILGTTCIAAEHVAILVLRCFQSRKQEWAASWGIMEYTQTAWSAGKLALSSEIAGCLQSAWVFELRDGIPFDLWIKQDKWALLEKRDERRRIRRILGPFHICVACSWGLSATGIALTKKAAMTGGVEWINALRFAGNFSNLVLLVWLAFQAHTFAKNAQHCGRTGAMIFQLCVMLCIISLYRSIFSFFTVPTLTKPDVFPRTAASYASKALFYIIQVNLELVVCFLQAWRNIRALCDDGGLGDSGKRTRVDSKRHEGIGGLESEGVHNTSNSRQFCISGWIPGWGHNERKEDDMELHSLSTTAPLRKPCPKHSKSNCEQESTKSVISWPSTSHAASTLISGESSTSHFQFGKESHSDKTHMQPTSSSSISRPPSLWSYSESHHASIREPSHLSPPLIQSVSIWSPRKSFWSLYR